MKVQTTVLLLCFFSGVFLSVVHAKPSPALMRELIALEKYLEKKEGPEGSQSETGGLNSNGIDGDILTEMLGNGPNKLRPGEENQNTENGPSDANQENNNNGEGQAGLSDAGGAGSQVDQNEKPTEEGGAVPSEKPEEGIPPENEKESSGHSEVTGDTGPAANGGEGKEEKPQEGNEPGPLKGQVAKGREKLFEEFDGAVSKIKEAVDLLDTLREKFRKLFQNDDLTKEELENKYKQKHISTVSKLDEMGSVIKTIKSELEEKRSDVKMSVQGNAPARRSHISDPEFLNIVHSLLKNN